MKKNTLRSLSLITGLALTLSLSSCDDFFGNKTELDFIEVPNFDPKPISYVPIQPVIGGMVRPVDICVGWDQLIYVADAGAQEILCFAENGERIGPAIRVPGLTQVVQDRKLDLLAIGTVDTTINGTPYSLSCIYRIRQSNGNQFGSGNARVVNKIVHPFYLSSATFASNEAQVRLTSLTVKADNSFYVTRTGNRTVGGIPDDAVLQFTADDKYLSNVLVDTETGLFSDYFRKPIEVVGTATPPQSTIVNEQGHFLYASDAPSNPIKVQFIVKVETENGTTFRLNTFDGGSDTTKADRYLLTPEQFTRPTGMCFSNDGKNLIFIADEGKDSIFVFSSNGYRGIAPPAGSATGSKYIDASFGGKGLGASQFNRPMAVAFVNRILYVADSGNGRVLRFRLSTDIR